MEMDERSSSSDFYTVIVILMLNIVNTNIANIDWVLERFI